MNEQDEPFAPPLSAESGQRQSGDIVMLYQGEYPHAAHQTFADNIGAEYRHFETGAPLGEGDDQRSIVARLQQAVHLDSRDVVIAEGTAPLQTLLAYKIRYPATTAIYLAADETFYTLSERPTRHVWSALQPATKRLLDGVIAVGEDAYEWCRPYLGDIPYRVVHPPIDDAKYDQLVSLSVSSPSNPFRILSVGTAQPSKRQHRIVESAERVVDDLDSELEVVFLGEGHEQASYADHDLVRTPGFVSIDEFADWFGKSSIYVQASEGDSYPVATLEAMLAGLPTVITEACGTQHRLPDEQVTSSSIKGLASRIRTLARWSQDKREDRGHAHRESVRDLTTDTQSRKFAAAVQELVMQ